MAFFSGLVMDSEVLFGSQAGIIPASPRGKRICFRGLAHFLHGGHGSGHPDRLSAQQGGSGTFGGGLGFSLDCKGTRTSHDGSSDCGQGGSGHGR